MGVATTASAASATSTGSKDSDNGCDTHHDVDNSFYNWPRTEKKGHQVKTKYSHKTPVYTSYYDQRQANPSEDAAFFMPHRYLL